MECHRYEIFVAKKYDCFRPDRLAYLKCTAPMEL